MVFMISAEDGIGLLWDFFSVNLTLCIFFSFVFLVLKIAGMCIGGKMQPLM
jgi:hypothetical protein